MLTPGVKMLSPTVFAAPARRARLGPARSPIDAASIFIVAVLSVLFAVAIVSSMRPAHLVDPLQASLEGGL